MKFFRIFSFFIIFSFLFSLNANSKNIIVGVYSDKPLIFKNKQGNADGFWIDLLKFIAKKKNLKLQYYYGEWTEIYNLLKKGKIDILPDIAITKERKKFFNFNNINVFTCWGEIVVHKDSKISNILDLKDKKIACVPDDIHCIEFKKLMKKFNINFTFVPVKRYIDSFHLISQKKVDAGAVNNIFYLNNSHNFPVKETSILYNPIDLRFAVTKGDPKKIIPLIDKEIESLKSDKNSYYYHLLNKWIKFSPENEIISRKLIIILLSLILGLVIIIFLLNWLINKKTKELKETNLTLNTLFNGISDAIFLHDENGVIKDVNEGMLRMYKVPKSYVIGKTIFDFSAEKSKFEYVKKIWEKVLKGEEISPIEWLAQKPFTKENFYVEVLLRKITIRGKDLILASVRDISEKKKYENEIIKVKKLESISFLAGGIAHDFNNLLTGIIANISLMKFFIEKGKLDQANRIIKKLDLITEKAQHLTNQLLTFSKGGEPVIEASSITDVITQTVDFILAGSNIKVEINIQKNLKNALIDKNQISQVIQNIIINSKEAMPSGGKIEVNCSNTTIKEQYLNIAPGEYIKIEIKDYGKGIPKDYIDKVFDPFFTTKEKGSGLGLAICHSIIKKHNGHIMIQSKQGEWTKCTILLPATDEKEKESKLSIDSNNNSNRKLNILIIDDESYIREFFQEIIEILNHNIFLAENSYEAIEIFRKENIDLVFIDLTIPGDISGKDILKKLKNINPKIKAIVMSGYSNDPVMSEYEKYGFIGFLKKPFKIDELKQIISENN